MSLSTPVKPVVFPLEAENQSTRTEGTKPSSQMQQSQRIVNENSPSSKCSEKNSKNVKSVKEIKCSECKSTFSKIRFLRHHITYKHPYLNKLPRKKRTVLRCDVCGITFSCVTSLRRHEQNFHNKVFPITDLRKCPLCSQEFRRKVFPTHLEESHGVLLKTEQLRFKSFEEFCAWKKVKEKDTKAHFRKLSGDKTDNGCKIQLFVCHRSGTLARNNQNEYKRKLKTKGSVKIGAYCPASLKVSISEDKCCEVTFQSVHVGHDYDVQYLPISFEERQFVASNLASGLPLRNVLDNLKKSKYSTERMRILTIKDLRNIKSQFFTNKSTDPSSFILGEGVLQKLQDICQKHIQSMSMKAVLSKFENGWILSVTADHEVAILKENLMTCSCQLSCIHCNNCFHSYSCSCADWSVANNMCKHIHFLCTVQHHEKVGANLSNADEVAEDVDGDLVMHNDSSSNSSDSTIVSNETHSLSGIPLDKRNDLKKRYMDLIDSATSLEQFEDLEKTLLQLTQRQTSSSNQSNLSNNNSNAIVPVVQDLSIVAGNNNSSEPTSIVRNLLLLPTSSPHEVATKPLPNILPKPHIPETVQFGYLIEFPANLNI